MGHSNRERCSADKVAKALEDRHQTPQDEIFQSDNVLKEVESELIWLGEERLYCLSCPEFNLTFSTNMRRLH
jgi:hypothetical protein